MKTQSEDTSPEVERVQIELLRKAGKTRRLQLGLELSGEALEMAQRAIKRAHPELGELEAKLLFVEITYGKDLADKVRAHLAKKQQ
jgi:hypothetical protein